ncbi:hypothetical protein V1278_000240 [Bradyrhizobium sp. AZCC 1577]
MAKDKSPSRADVTGMSASQPDKLDLLVGAEAIAMFMFGDPDATRRIYHAWEAHGLPAFKVGQALWARKGALVAWVDAKELEAAPPSDPPAM